MSQGVTLAIAIPSGVIIGLVGGWYAHRRRSRNGR